MFKFRTLLLFALFFVAIKEFNAQEIIVDKLTAGQYFDYEDYNRALDQYLKLYASNKEDVEINYQIGFCYLNVNRDRAQAIPYLEFVKKSGKYPTEIFLLLGKAYMYAYKFDEAIKNFSEYRAKLSDKELESVDLLIANCETAKELIKVPINVSFENLGPVINTKYADYYPFVIENEGAIYFTSRRNENTGKLENWQAYYTSDIYSAKVKNGEWIKAKNIGVGINTSQDEQCVYVTPDGKTMIIYKDDLQKDLSGDLYVSSVGKNKSFSRPVLFEEPVNSTYTEFEGCINTEENLLIVASDRPGTLGDTDLWMFKRLPNGGWGAPINLGSNVNTKRKEAFPIYDEKEKILYFASEGHTNMGGFDIFKSEFDVTTQTFGPAINMGYPINTPEDNMEFTLAANKRDGYISAVRKEGYGDLDIYKVTFNDVEKPISVLRGVVSVTDTAQKDIDAMVTLIDAKTKEEIDSKNVNSKTGRYIFVVEPGKYILHVTSDGYEDNAQSIAVYDKSDYAFEIEKNIVLLKPGEVIEPVNPTTPAKPTTNTAAKPPVKK